MRRESEARAEATARAAEPAPKEATVSRGVISGTVPFRPDLAPAWLDERLDAGGMLAPTAPLI